MSKSTRAASTPTISPSPSRDDMNSSVSGASSVSVFTLTQRAHRVDPNWKRSPIDWWLQERFVALLFFVILVAAAIVVLV